MLYALVAPRAWNTDVMAALRLPCGKCEDESQALRKAEWRGGKSPHCGTPIPALDYPLLEVFFMREKYADGGVGKGRKQEILGLLLSIWI